MSEGTKATTSEFSIDDLGEDYLVILAAFKMGGVTYSHNPFGDSDFYWCMSEHVVEDEINALMEMGFISWHEYLNT